MFICGRLLKRTTVSVTKGMGKAALGALDGAAWCCGENEGRVERLRALCLGTLRALCKCERAARNTDLDMGSIDVYESVLYLNWRHVKRSSYFLFGKLSAITEVVFIFQHATLPPTHSTTLMLNVKSSWAFSALTKGGTRAGNVIRVQVAARHAVARRTITSLYTPQPQPTVSSEDGEWTLRTRQHGAKSLPLPPLMDDVAIKRKNKYKAPKAWNPRASEEQQELEDNVYGTSHTEQHVRSHTDQNDTAQALATPVRACAITGARLPSHFLLPLVVRLLPAPSPHDAHKSSPTKKAELIPECLLDLSTNPDSIVSPSRVYISNQRHILDAAKQKRWLRLHNEHMRKWYSLKMARSGTDVNVKKEWIWDDETTEKVLRYLRVGVQRRVERGVMREKPCIVRLEMAETAKADVAYLLRLTKPGPKGSTPKPALLVYDLTSLLSPDTMPQLPEDRSKDCAYMAVVKGGAARGLQLALLKLQGFLAEPGE